MARVIRMIGRLIGWIVFLAGVAVLVRDALVWIDTKHWAPIALGQLWFDLDRSSLNLVQAVVSATSTLFYGTRSSSRSSYGGHLRC